MAKKRSETPRSMWRGTISFGLVNIPVRMYPAVREKNIHFHMLHDQDKSRLQRRMVCPVEDKEVPSEHIIKGYEISPGRHVIVDEKELEAIAPKASRAIEVISFVDLEEIDPIYYEHPYYLLPEDGSERSFSLFVEAMGRTKKVAVVKFVMRAKEYLGAVRVVNDVLMLETMYHADEIIPADRLDFKAPKGKIGERELKTAEQLIDSLSSKFDPEELKDEYREAVMKLVEKKAEGEEIAIEPEKAPQKTEVSDILAALEASLAEARKKGKHKQHAHA
ncbi:MAG: Ku protein [Elusimicrobia bacterium]|nr:Ku protein [Elusimicrobiota bacterium]